MGYALPVTAPISSSWADHKRRRPPSSEPGTDRASALGTPVLAAEAGRVADVKRTTSGAMGRFVTIDLNDGRRVRYIHLAETLVRVGDRVSRGQIVGKSGGSAYGRENGVAYHVHTTLWPSHEYVFRTDATLDFETYADGDFDPAVKSRQEWLNHYSAEKLSVDGIKGPATTEAYKRYQRKLAKINLYSGDIDGEWGPATEAGHQEVVKVWSKKVAAEKAAAEKTKPKPATFPKVTVANLGKIGDVRGLQKIAALNGYKGKIDNVWGPGSQAGFQKFLAAQYGGSVVSWLKSRWGYVGNDQLGPVMTAALKRANAENFKAL